MSRLKVEKLEKTYRSRTENVTVFKDINFHIREGEQVALVGESGAGKSTLLHLLGALDTPTDGGIYFGGFLLSDFSSFEHARYRNENVGFVWQNHNLLAEFTTVENVMMPMLIGGTPRSSAHRQAQSLLEQMGLFRHGHRRIGELSGGEQQRVAIARALARKPSLLLADEPTGNLDFRTATRVMDSLQEMHASRRFMSVIATHNLDLAARCDRILKLADGNLTELEPPPLQTEAH